jgi:molybdenum cofactor guanylyltransferase
MISPVPASITGLILAGGLSRRMNNREKAFLPLAGKPMLSHVLTRLTPQVGTVVLNANGDPARFAAFNRPVVADVRPGFLGPLAGIEAAFLSLNVDWLLSVPVDTPFFPKDLAAQMCQMAQGGEVPVVVESAGRLHPVLALWPRGILGDLTKVLDAKQLRLHDWFEHQEHRRLSIPIEEGGEDPFFNINRPDEQVLAESRLRKQK